MPFPARRSTPSIDSRRHATPQARMIVRARRSVEVHLPGRGVDSLDRPGHEDLGAEPARLLQRATRKLVPRHARWEAEVILDPGGRAGLAAGRLALDGDRAQPLRRSVHGRGQARRARAHDNRVVIGPGRLGAEAEQLGHPAVVRSYHGLAVDHADRRHVFFGGQRASPPLFRIRRVGRQPPERDLVAIQEAPQLGAGCIPAMPDHDRSRRRRLGREALQSAPTAHPVAASRPTSVATSGTTAATAW
jgi:hypothetical protein